MIEGPCKDCPERHEACWGVCDKYAEYRARLDTMREEMRRRNQRFTTKAMQDWKRRA